MKFRMLMFLFFLFTACSPGPGFRWIHNNPHNLSCVNCTKLNQLPSEATWLEINDESCPLVPAAIFENQNLCTLIVYSAELQYEAVTKRTGLTAFSQPEPVVEEIPSVLQHSQDLKSLVLFLSNQEAAKEGIVYDSLKYLMLGINTVKGELVSPMLSSPALETLRVLTQEGTITWPNDQKLSDSITLFKAPIDLSGNMGLFDGLDKLESISITRISNLKEGLKYLSKLPSLKAVQIDELRRGEISIISEFLPHVRYGISSIALLPISWGED